jgi:hypothetical protein
VVVRARLLLQDIRLQSRAVDVSHAFARKRHSLVEFYNLCLSRACLGKMIILRSKVDTRCRPLT